jgi:hypothetical protein
MTTARGETISKVREEPYAIVNGCDGHGEFVVFGVYPNNSKRGDFTVYGIRARLADGVIDGFVKARYDTDLSELATKDGNYAIRISLAEALVLFLDPVVARTKELPPDTIPVIRWWQQHRRPGPQRFEDFVLPILNKKELARIAEFMKAFEYFRDSTEAERESLKDHQEKFENHFFAAIKSWFLSEAELQEIGATVGSSANDILFCWLESEHLIQRHTQMAGHMRLLYKLGGENPDLADLWSTEVKLQIGLGAFIYSGLAHCVSNLTSTIHAHDSGSSGTEPLRRRFFHTPEIEEKGLTVLRGVGAWSCFANLAEDPLLEDLYYETSRLLREGISNILGWLIKFDATDKNTIQETLAELLLRSFDEWNRMYVFRHEGPLASADKDPPSDFVTDILNRINEEKSQENHAQDISGALSRAFWDVACMAIHPELFHYPTGTGDRGVRKTTSTSVTPSRPPPFEEALPLLVAACCSANRWLDMFSKVKLQTLKKRLTVRVHPSETVNAQRILCPRHFSLDAETMVPSDELLHRFTNGDNPYLTRLFKLMAVQLPHTTLRVLEGVKLLREAIDNTHKKVLIKLEANRGTSTTKKQKEQCAGCGSKEEIVKKLMKCTGCKIVRYCSVGCQKKHWPVHKKVCAPVKK